MVLATNMVLCLNAAIIRIATDAINPIGYVISTVASRIVVIALEFRLHEGQIGTQVLLAKRKKSSLQSKVPKRQQ